MNTDSRYKYAAWIYRIAVLAVVLLTGQAIAQTTTGSIYGTVTDATGAVIPNAVVTATNADTTLAQTAKTNSSGEYVFQALNPGNYTVATTVAGFKSVTQQDVVLSSNQNVHVGFSLEAGASDQSVTISAETTLVDTREAQLAETVDQRRIQELPLNGRDAYDLLTLVPGVSKYTPDTSVTGTRSGILVSVNGLPTNASSYYLDGAYDTTFFTNGGNLLPNPDALQEFRVLTSNFDAEFGRNPGAVVNVITASGTNTYHGMAYEYLRNNIFNAKNYFLTSVTSLKQNQFGGNFGGGIPFLPKDRAFFFLSYERLIVHTPASVGATAIVTATALERTGDFSVSPTKPTLPAGTNCGTTAAPKICPAALDPVAQTLLGFVPVEDPSRLFTTQQQANGNSQANQGLGRIDYQLTPAHQLEAMFFNSRGTNLQPTVGVNRITSYSGMSNYENQVNTALVDTWTISPNTVNSLRAFYTQNRYIIANIYNNHFLPNLGSLAPEGGAISAAPLFTITGYWAMGTNTNGPSDISQLSFGLIDTANLTRGHHQIKLGGAFVRNKYAETGGNQSNGIFTFSGAQTSSSPTVNNGNALADFLLGKAATLVQTTSVLHRTHSNDPSLFAQDDWQITKRLDINIGVRWELFAPFTGDHLNGTFQAGVQSKVFPTAPIGILYQGDTGIPDGIWRTPLTDFAPRVGFAYDVFGDGRTSLRGGYGIFYSFQGEAQSSNQQQLPYALTENISVTPNLVCPYGGTVPPCPVGTAAGTDPFPYTVNTTAPNFTAYSGTTAVAAVPVGGGSIPYVYEYNLTLEQQLNKQWGLRVGYVGNSARKFHLIHDINTPAYSPTCTAATCTKTVALVNARRPYQPLAAPGFQFAAINLDDNADNFSYNGLQTSLRGRMGKSLTVLATYVWSKALSYEPTTVAPAVPVNAADIRSDYGHASTDLRNVFSASFLYTLPNVKLWGLFGTEVLSGWQINGLITMQSGSSFTVLSGSDTNFDNVANDRANIVADPYTHAGTRQQKIQSYLNPAAFAVPTGPYGNEQNNSIIGPRNIVTNASLFKIFEIHNNWKLQARAEAFNALNNVNLGNPVANRTTLNTDATTHANQITSAGDPRILQFALKLMF